MQHNYRAAPSQMSNLCLESRPSLQAIQYGSLWNYKHLTAQIKQITESAWQVKDRNVPPTESQWAENHLSEPISLNVINKQKKCIHIFTLHSKPAERFASPPPTPSTAASLHAADVNLKLMSWENVLKHIYILQNEHRGKWTGCFKHNESYWSKLCIEKVINASRKPQFLFASQRLLIWYVNKLQMQ